MVMKEKWVTPDNPVHPRKDKDLAYWVSKYAAELGGDSMPKLMPEGKRDPESLYNAIMDELHLYMEPNFEKHDLRGVDNQHFGEILHGIQDSTGVKFPLLLAMQAINAFGKNRSTFDQLGYEYHLHPSLRIFKDVPVADLPEPKEAEPSDLMVAIGQYCRARFKFGIPREGWYSTKTIGIVPAGDEVTPSGWVKRDYHLRYTPMNEKYGTIPYLENEDVFKTILIGALREARALVITGEIFTAYVTVGAEVVQKRHERVIPERAFYPDHSYIGRLIHETLGSLDEDSQPILIITEEKDIEQYELIGHYAIRENEGEGWCKSPEDNAYGFHNRYTPERSYRDRFATQRLY